MKVVVDSVQNSTAYCRSEFDAPEIDNEIIVKSAAGMKEGNYYNVKIVDSYEYDLFAEYKNEK